jgi:hypothetical protein
MPYHHKWVIPLCYLALLAGCDGGGGGNDSIITEENEARIFEAVTTGDFDGDGLSDVFFAFRKFTLDNEDARLSIQTQRADAPRRFNTPLTYQSGEGPASISLGDLNADGRLDTVVGYYRKDFVSLHLQSSAAPGTLLNRSNLSTPQDAWEAAIADLNGDGLVDLAVAAADLAILFNDPGNPGDFYTSTLIPLETYAVAAADLDGDGRVDIVATSSDDRVRVLLQSPAPIPAGDFSQISSYSSGPSPLGVVIADLNSDGLADIAVANMGTDGQDYTNTSVGLLLQDPANRGDFLPVQYFETAGESRDVAAGDLNNDGRTDLVASNYRVSKAVSVFFQAADGTLDAAVEVGVDGRSLQVSVADLDNDGLNDIAVATEARGRVLWQDRSAPGTFLEPAIILGN